MLEILPRRAFFRFEFPVYRLARSPRIDGDTAKWQARYRAPLLYKLDGDEKLADVWWAWNDEQFFVAYNVVMGRRPECDPLQWWKMDGVRFCINTRNVARASRFSYFFYMLPVGGGTGKRQPIIGMHKLNRAKEFPAKIDMGEIQLAAVVSARGYSLEAAFPTRLLNGFDPVEQPRVGLFYKVKDHLGMSQCFSATDDLGWNVDPEVWGEGVLTRD